MELSSYSEGRICFEEGIQTKFLIDVWKESKLTNTEFAKSIGVSFACLKNWKYGNTLISIPAFIKIENIAPKTFVRYKREIKEILPEKWGSIKGGKGAIKTIKLKYGEAELTKRRMNGGIRYKINIQNKIEKEIEEFKTNKKEILELYGILIGDGCLYKYKYKNKLIKRVRIDGSINDIPYYQDYIIPFFQDVFGKKTKLKRRKDCESIHIEFNSNKIFEIFHRKMNFPIGVKGEIKIDERLCVLSEKEVDYILRGIFDTDGSLFFVNKKYPYISIVNKSHSLIEQIADILQKRGYHYYINKSKVTGVYYLVLSGKKNLEKWMNKIGSNNLNQLSKYLYWKRFGECPSEKELSMRDRLKRLNLAYNNLNGPLTQPGQMWAPRALTDQSASLI